MTLLFAFDFAIDRASAQELKLDENEAVDTRVEDAASPGSSQLDPASDAAAAAREAERRAREQMAEELEQQEAEETRRKRAETPATKAAAKTGPKPSLKPRVVAFRVRDIVFTVSDYLSVDELAAVEATFVGERLRVDQVLRIAAAVNALYTAKNIALAEALVTGVDPRTGTVSIELFEARIGAVAYKAMNISDAYLDFRLGLKPGDLADNRRIDAVLRRLAITDGIRLDASFNPGAARGLTDLVIATSEQKPVSGSVSIDSYGTPAKGIARLMGSIRAASVTGWNDPLTANVTVSQGSASISASYARVIAPGGARVVFSAGTTKSKTISAPLVEGQTGYAEAGLDVPLVVRDDGRLNFYLGAQRFFETSKLLGVQIIDQDGWAFIATASSALYGQGWQVSSSATVRSALYDDRIFGLNDRQTWNLGGSLSLTYALSPSYLFTLTAAGQLGLATQPTQLKFDVMSPFAVRGYQTGLSSGDSGYFARAQIERAKPLDLGSEAIKVYPFVFADVGEAFDSSAGLQVGQGLAVSVGAGMSVGLGENVFGDIYVAKPLNNAAGFVAANAWSVMGSIGVAF